MKMALQRPVRYKTARVQRGLTLIELMVALVLGLLIVSAVLNVFVGSVATTTYRDGVLAMQQNGHFGISTLKEGIQSAGYSPDVPIEPFDIDASSATQLVVRVNTDQDCNGGDTTPFGGVAVNTYRYDVASSSIICRGNTAAAQNMVLVSGVDQFRYQFGVDLDFDGYVDQYVPYANSINPLTVLSVRVGILVNSGKPIKKVASRKVFAVLDRAVRKKDKLSRQVFTSTIILKNRFKPY